MKPLTLKQENFCLAFIESGNASESYRRSYDVSKMNEASINRKAKDMIDNVKIRARVSELRKPIIEAAQINLAGHLRDLRVLRDRAEKEGRYSAAVSAEIARGKASGLYVDKIEINLMNGLAERIARAKAAAKLS